MDRRCEDSASPGRDLDRRQLMRLGMGGAIGLPLAGLVDAPALRAAARDLKLADVQEFTTACNFCSCGCGMVATVRDGKLLTLEGDFDHPVNGGSLCVKGMAMLPTHASPRRLQKPMYRAPGSDQWVELTWKDAAERIAKKIKQTRDETWIATEKVDDAEVPVNRTDAIAFLGGAQNTNEECYLFQKAARLMGIPFVEHQARL
jgi:formate dehydrogenase major subunit